MRALAVSVVAAGVFAFGLLLASCGEDGEEASTTTSLTSTQTVTATLTTTTTATTPPPPRPTVVRVVVENGQPKGGIARPTVTQGDRVVLVVESDVADEVHLHGYDLTRNVSAGGTARMAFEANVPGRFEVELEDRGVQIAELTVRP